MSSYKIVVIAPDFELYQTASQVREEVTFAYEVVHANLDEAVLIARQLIDTGTVVLISRGGTLDRLRASFPDMPLVGIPITEYEVAATLATAKRISPVAAVVGFSNPLIQGAEKLAGMLDLNLKTYLVSSHDAIEAQVCKAQQEGYGVVIGFKAAYDCAVRLGIPAVQFNSQYEVVKKSLLDAKALLNTITREEEWKKRQTTVLNSISSAIFIVDCNGTIADRNKTAGPIEKALAGSDALHKIFTHEFARVASGETIVNVFQRIGAVDYNCSLYPIVLDKLITGIVIILEELSRLREIEHTARRKSVETGLKARYYFSDIQTSDPGMLRLVKQCTRYAQSDSTVMLYGESGTGKELLAQGIHNASLRAGMPFLAINCGALPENILESELFGYVEGAFTGARRSGKMGAFEQAHRGTLFLDEVGEISPMAQSRLLRTLEERQIMRLGDNKVIPVDVRIICATHCDLDAMNRAGTFRSDLFYRLNVLKVTVPPLRQRRGDIRILLEHFIRILVKKGRRESPLLSGQALALIEAYAWPGNVRELRNVAERIVVGLDEGPVSLETMLEILCLTKEEAVHLAPQTVKDQEQVLIMTKLREHKNSRTLAAQSLGMSKSTLWRRMKAMGIKD